VHLICAWNRILGVGVTRWLSQSGAAGSLLLADQDAGPQAGAAKETGAARGCGASQHVVPPSPVPLIDPRAHVRRAGHGAGVDDPPRWSTLSVFPLSTEVRDAPAGSLDGLRAITEFSVVSRFALAADHAGLSVPDEGQLFRMGDAFMRATGTLTPATVKLSLRLDGHHVPRGPLTSLPPNIARAAAFTSSASATLDTLVSNGGLPNANEHERTSTGVSSNRVLDCVRRREGSHSWRCVRR